MKAIIIGCGGGGSWMAPAMCSLIGPSNVMLVDGDKLERKNLDRQLFDAADIGRNKAEALGRRYNCSFVPDWYSFGSMSHRLDDWLMVGVDNHPGRVAALMACDFEGCSAIIAANETHSSEAYVYLPAWKDTNLDPRVMYPEMLTSQQGDPRRAAIGCTGEAQATNRQLVTANLMAVSLALHLFVVWAMESRKLDQEVLSSLPHHLRMNLTKPECFKALITQRTNT
jgi:hypothetical protein